MGRKKTEGDRVKVNSIISSIFVFVLLLGSVQAATSTLNTFTVTPSNSTVNGNTTYNITLSYITLVNSLYSANVTFPFDTRFNATTLPSNVSNVLSNISGANANGSVNLSMVVSNTSSSLGEVDFIFNYTSGATLTIGNQYYISFTVTTTSNPRSANGSTTYNGFSAYALLYTINGTQSAGSTGNTTTYTLIPQNATNYTVSFGNAQSVTANSTPTYPLTVLVTDTFGNPFGTQLMNFSVRNYTSTSANATVSANGTAPIGVTSNWLWSFVGNTNSTGQVGAFFHVGQESGTYQVNVTNGSASGTNDFSNGTTFLLFNESVANSYPNALTPVTVGISNATVNGNTTRNISFMFTAPLATLYSINMTFPFDTRFNGSNLVNVTSNVSGSVANWTVNGTAVISNATMGSEVDVVFNTTGNLSLNVGNTYYFSIIFSNVANSRSANGSATYGGFTLTTAGFINNGTQILTTNTTTYTLVPQNATNVTALFGGSQTVTVNSTPTYNLTALVTDRYGNPFSGFHLNFTSLNTSNSIYNLTISLNGSNPYGYVAGGWYSTVHAYTNATGQANVTAFMGQSTGNSTSTVYQVQAWNASNAVTLTDFSANATFNLTPSSDKINYYLLTPSSSTPAANTQFNVLVSSYDAFSNINTSSDWKPSISAAADHVSSLQYNLDGSSTYSTYGSAVQLALVSGNDTIYFKHGYNDGITFTVGDSNSASGATAVTVQGGGSGSGSGTGSGGGGYSSGSGGSTPTPTPTPAPTPKVEEQNLDTSTKVTGSFADSSTSFELTYFAGADGFYGDMSWKLPLDFADYQAGKITITPKPSSVKAGSVVATWNNIDLAAGAAFTATVSVSKKLDSTLMQNFVIPTLSGKAKPTPGPTTAVATPTPAPTQQTGGVKGTVKAGQDYTLWIVLLLVIIIAGAYYYWSTKKKH